MSPYYRDNHITVYNKSCRDMSELPDESVQCVITSPPYWGLRKYSGVADLVWGGRADCEHRWDIDTTAIQGNNSMVRGQGETDSGAFAIPKFKETDMKQRKEVVGNFCSLCGAWKGQYGLEPTPEMYIEHTVEILREIRRVLRKDGVCFWNIGDSYAGNKTGNTETIKNPKAVTDTFAKALSPGQKPKDLCLIPFRVAIAAQEPWYKCKYCGEESSGWSVLRPRKYAWIHYFCPICGKEQTRAKMVEDGWWVRSDIIWSKPNPMPESVTDRPTNSHEHILMLTKSARYYWDADAVREEYTEPMNRWGGDILRADGESMWDKGTGQSTYRDRNMRPNPAGRNIRSVWTFPTQPYPEAHFAVFPEKLPEICIKAATPEVGCCSECGAPWERVTDTNYEKRATRHPTEKYASVNNGVKPNPGDFMGNKIVETIGWQPTCNCNADKAPSLVLDPFLGAGTTAWVAKRLNRRCVGYELSGEYCELIVKRNRQQVLI